MSREEFQKVFTDQLSDIYSAENQLVKALPKMAAEAKSPDLKEAFTHHLQETKEQVSRLNQIFKMLGETPSNETCAAMKGMVKECEEAFEEYTPSLSRDAVLIGLAQRVEHYEMAVYGTLIAFAKQLGLDDEADLMQKSLNEEGKANKKLTEIAEGGFFTEGINQKAASKK